MYKWFVCLLLALTYGWAAGTVYYVDPVHGNDANDGSNGSPWKTVKRAMADHKSSPRVTFGDIVLLRDGNYADVVFGYSSPLGSSWDDAITYKADTGHDPVFRTLTFEAETGSVRTWYIEVNDVNINPTAGGSNAIWCNNGVGNLRFYNLDIRGPWNTDYSDMRERDANGYKALAHGIVFDNIYEINDITIQDCDITQVNIAIKMACKVGAGGVMIQGNTIDTTAGTACNIGIHSHLSTGLTTIKGNTISNFYSFFNGRDMNHASGIGVRKSHVTIEGNIIRSHGSTGSITFYSGMTAPDWRGWGNITIQNNVVYDPYNATALRFGAISDDPVLIRNNTFIGYDQSRHFRDARMHYGALMWLKPYDNGVDPCECNNLKVHNNIIVGRLELHDKNNTGLSGMVEDYNFIYSLYDYDDRRYLTSHDNTTVCARANSFNTVFERAFFANPCYFARPRPSRIVSDYSLLPTAAVVGEGDASNAPPADIVGNVRKNPCDIGAHEFVDLKK
jgi:hypothetical protein